MKKIFTLAIIALASVSMVACCGQAEKKCCDKPQPAVVEEKCDKSNCNECEKKKDCPQAKTVETPAPETPVKK